MSTTRKTLCSGTFAAVSLVVPRSLQKSRTLAWVLFIWIAIVVFGDIFRRRDISGWGKAAWIVLIVILPWIGVLVYLIANHDGMAERKRKANSGGASAVRPVRPAGCR